MSNIISTIKNHPLTTLEVIAIWVVCMIPVPETPLAEIRFIDKWTHFVMYGSLSLVVWAEHYYRFGKKPWMAWACAIVMGGIIELAQAYLTTCRSGDWFDFLCNSLGVILGILIANLINIYYSGTKP